MKQTLIMSALLALAKAENAQLNSVVTPSFITGLITVFFLYVMLMFGFGQLMDIQTPPYRLKYDEKNKEANTDWSRIWGEIEK